MTAWFEPGVILAGKYRVERVLGRGGMGVVVAARHLQLDELVAIKFLIPEVASNTEAVARFEREARAAVKIKNEHVCRVSDVGTLDGGAPYMVMEYLDGRDLLDVLQGRGFLPLDEAVDYVLQASEAIAEAHAVGIVHRDLKPANLFLIQRPDGSACIKVLDFGISKLTGRAENGLAITGTSAMMGSPLYTSPEQLTSARDVDVTADVWGLGVILFELLTGTLPFLGETLPEVCARILGSPPKTLSSVRPDLPPGIEAIVNGCLEKDRTKRIPSVLELARRLSEYAPRRSRTSLERISGVAGAAGTASSGLALPPPSSQDPPHSGTLAEFGTTGLGRSSGKWWLVGAAALVLVGLTGYAFLRSATGNKGEVAVAGSRNAAAGADAAPPASVTDATLAIAAPTVASASTPLVAPLPSVSSSLERAPQAATSVQPASKSARNLTSDARVSPAGRPVSNSDAARGAAMKKDPEDWGGRL